MKDLIIKDLDNKINNLIIYDYDIMDIDNSNSKIIIKGIDFILNIYKKTNGKISFLKQGKDPDKADDLIKYLTK